MDIQAEKIELVKMLLDTEDTTLIEQIKALFKTREEDFYLNLPQHVKDGIEKSRKQAEEGKVISLDEVFARLDARK
jgi:hypothetical protein